MMAQKISSKKKEHTMFKKPYTSADLQLVRSTEISVGDSMPIPPAYYPEAFYRLRVKVKTEADLYIDKSEIVAESSGLFWDPCTSAQILMYAENEQYIWSLALTRFGGLRWELKERHNKQVLSELEVEPITHLLDVDREFYLGLTLACSKDRHVVKLLVGQRDGMITEAENTELPENMQALSEYIILGCGPNDLRPFSGEITEIIVANTVRYQLYDYPETCEGIDASFPCGSVLAAHYVNDKCIAVFSGAEFASTDCNYWYYFLLKDNNVRSIIIEEMSNMSGHFFISEDQDNWLPIKTFSIGKSLEGKRRARIDLPERNKEVYIASSMVYAEKARDRDLKKAKNLGAKVQKVATSTLGLPVYVITLTDKKTPLQNKKAVVLHCGQHSPLEQSGGFLGMPCLEELLKINEQNNILEKFVFYWVPLFNVDCAHYGTPGNDARCTNPNRHWHENKAPEHIGVQDFLRYQAQKGVDMRFLFDIHMGGWRNHTLLPYYVVEHSEDIDLNNLSGKNAEKTKYINALYKICGIREVWSNTTQTDNPNCCSAWFQSTFDACSMVLEGSVSTYFDPVQQKTLPFTNESFAQLGRNLAHFFTSDIILKG